MRLSVTVIADQPPAFLSFCLITVTLWCSGVPDYYNGSNANFGAEFPTGGSPWSTIRANSTSVISKLYLLLSLALCKVNVHHFQHHIMELRPMPELWLLKIKPFSNQSWPVGDLSLLKDYCSLDLGTLIYSFCTIMYVKL